MEKSISVAETVTTVWDCSSHQISRHQIEASHFVAMSLSSQNPLAVFVFTMKKLRPGGSSVKKCQSTQTFFTRSCSGGVPSKYSSMRLPESKFPNLFLEAVEGRRNQNDGPDCDSR